MDTRTVLVIATLDTKSDEVAYLVRRLESHGVQALLLDTGILGEPHGLQPDVPASETARAAGTTLDALRRKGTRGLAIEEMLVGAREITRRLGAEGRVQGAISLGGAEGAVMAASAMQALPPGFPKLILSPLAAGHRPFGPFVGIRDIMVMHSLTDIAGVNDISRTVFDNAAAAIAGMARAYVPMTVTQRNLVALTTLGTTDRAMRHVFARLQAAGYEPVIFHSSGVGGQVMEDMIARGFFRGVVDLCTNELTDHEVGAYHDAGPHRLEAAGRCGVPQVVSTGCVDFFATGPRESIPEKWRGRKSYYHNPAFTLIRPTVDELRRIGSALAAKVNAARGPVRVVLPLRGMSIAGLPGGSTHDPEGDRALFDAIRRGLRPDVRVVEVERHVNEPEFADALTSEFLSMLAAHPAPAQEGERWSRTISGTSAT
jgi:uncharacterized protein (UPF0261 family)